MKLQHTLRRHSVESTSSAAREFNGYHLADANSSDSAVPTIETITNTNDHLAPTELRQRVRNSFTLTFLCDANQFD